MRNQNETQGNKLRVYVLDIMGKINQMQLSGRGGRLTLKQAPNGSVLIGGGWQGVADLDSDDSRIIPHNAINNVRLARHAVPALKGARIVRTWLGLQDRPPDHQPLAGPLPGVPGAFIISCAASGFTMGPYLGRLMADSLLGREPEMPLFDVAHAVVADDRRT